MPGEITFRWLGVAGFSLESDGYILAVDPFFTRPPLKYIFGGRPESRPELAEQYLPACDAILVTHAHHDHLMDAPEIARRTGARLYGSPNSCRIAQLCGLAEEQTRVVQAGESFTAGPFQVRVVAAQHIGVPFYGPGALKANLRAPLKLHEYRMDDDFSYLIEASGLRVLDWMSFAPQGAERADVLVCGPLMREPNLGRLLEMVQPRLVIPIHWDNFFRPLEWGLRVLPWTRWLRRDAQSFAERVRGLDRVILVWIPELFSKRDLGAMIGRPAVEAGKPATKAV